ncbi:thioesterase II family protein [Streptomyces chattanoogensis]|uniref:thioesterase II family protein n=1 Tax=Streptomyces chattanoogensis TaxID=66876 RepID=UPI00099DA0B9
MTTSAAQQSDWLRRFHPTPQARIRLVCFPHAGGSASYYFPMSAALSPAVEVVSVQYPGRQDRRKEPCIDDIGELADRIDAELRAGQAGAGLPVAFFGHSMGAVLAFEVALRVEQRGGPGPVRVFASGRRAPSRSRPGAVHQQSDAVLIEEMRRLGGTDSRWLQNEELMAVVLPVLRSDYRAVERYRSGPDRVIDAPITVLTGDADPHTSAEEAQAWSGHTRGGFALSTFSGGHFFLEQHQAAVIGTVTEALGPLLDR